ncbi:MAG: hypothetical protein R6U98_17415 [Pirellulaceae bacterium]
MFLRSLLKGSPAGGRATIEQIKKNEPRRTYRDVVFGSVNHRQATSTDDSRRAMCGQGRAPPASDDSSHRETRPSDTARWVAVIIK